MFKKNYINFTVTRSYQRLLDSMQVRDCFVGLERNIQAETLSWLNMTESTRTTVNEASCANNASNISDISTQQENQQNTASRSNRRASVASTNLFVVGNNVQDMGFDYLQKIPRSNRVNFGHVTSGTDVIATASTSAVPNPVDNEIEVTSAMVPKNATVEPVDDGDDDGYLYLTEQFGVQNPLNQTDQTTFDEDVTLAEFFSQFKADSSEGSDTLEEASEASAMVVSVGPVDNEPNQTDQTIALEIEILDEDFNLDEFFGQFEADSSDGFDTLEEAEEASEACAMVASVGPVDNDDSSAELNLFCGCESLDTVDKGKADKVVWTSSCANKGESHVLFFYFCDTWNFDIFYFFLQMTKNPNVWFFRTISIHFEDCQHGHSLLVIVNEQCHLILATTATMVNLFLVRFHPLHQCADAHRPSFPTWKP